MPSALTVIGTMVLAQFALGLAIFVDASRRNLKHAVGYFFGALIPLLGLVVGLVYVSRRSALPSQTAPGPDAVDPSDERAWTVRVRSLWRLPRRLAYSAVHATPLFWGLSIVSPLLLFASAVLLADVYAVLLFMFSGTLWILYLYAASRYTNTTTRLDPEAGRIEVTRHGSAHPLPPNASEDEIDLDDVQCVDLLQFGRYPMVRLRYENHYISTGPRAFLVPESRLDAVRDLLADQEVNLRDRRGGRYEWYRVLGATVSVALVPLTAVALWPQYVDVEPVSWLAFWALLWVLLKVGADLAGPVADSHRE